MTFNKYGIHAFFTIAIAVAVLASAALPPMPPQPDFMVKVKKRSNEVELTFRNIRGINSWMLQSSTNLIDWEDLVWSDGSPWLAVAVESKMAGKSVFYRAAVK